jgi:hypothetical protein
MRICVEHGMFTLSFMREATTHVSTCPTSNLSNVLTGIVPLLA